MLHIAQLLQTTGRQGDRDLSRLSPGAACDYFSGLFPLNSILLTVRLQLGHDFPGEQLETVASARRIHTWQGHHQCQMRAR